MCKDRIEEAVMSVPGVTEASWDMKTKLITLTLNRKPAEELNIHQAIARTGHDTEKVKADDGVYQALPECCRYRSGP
jgi:Cu(I)/Ag(I) efflux system membrane fusion protein